MQKRLAVGAVVLGTGLLIVGVIGTITSDGEATAAEPSTTAAAAEPSTTAAATSSTTDLPASTDAPPTTAVSSTTTSTTAATSTTSTTTTTTLAPVPVETVDDFASAFASALAEGDSDFVFDRLHPVVLALYDTDLCRAFIDREIMLITDYRLTGAPTGPTSVQFDTPEGTVSVAELIKAPVSFTFQGQAVDTEGAFAAVDGEMRWFTDCR